MRYLHLKKNPGHHILLLFHLKINEIQKKIANFALRDKECVIRSEQCNTQMQFTVAQIAAMVGGSIEGNPEAMVSTFAKIEEGHPGAISFLANEKYTHHIYTTGSTAVLVSRDFKPEHPLETTLIRVDDPYSTVASLLEMVAKIVEPSPVGIEQPCFIAEGVEIPEDAYIGAFAYIGKGVRLGKGVKLYPQTYVGENSEIGDGTVLKPGVKVYHGCKIGARCVLHSGVVIGGDGFGFAPHDGHYHKIPQLGNVEIADDVEIGANTTVDRAVMGSTRIGRGTKLDNLIQIAHNCSVGSDTVMAAQAGVAGSTHIGSSCMIGGQVGFAGHIKVGDNVQIGAQSGIPADVPDNAKVMGYPAVDYPTFARTTIHLKNLGDLYTRVRNLEKSNKKNSKDNEPTHS